MEIIKNYNPTIKDKARKIKEEALQKIKRITYEKGKYFDFDGNEYELPVKKKMKAKVNEVKESLHRLKRDLLEKKKKEFDKIQDKDNDEKDLQERVNFSFFKRKLNEVAKRLLFLEKRLREEEQEQAQAQETTNDQTQVSSTTDTTQQQLPTLQVPTEIVNEIQNLTTIINNLNNMINSKGLSPNSQNNLGADVESQIPASNNTAEVNTNLSEGLRRKLLRKVIREKSENPSYLNYSNPIEGDREFFDEIFTEKGYYRAKDEDVDEDDTLNNLDYTRKNLTYSKNPTWKVPEIEYASKKSIKNENKNTPTNKFIEKVIEKKSWNFNQLIKDGRLG